MIITTEKIKKCITLNLKTLFSDINIYKDTVKQGLTYPCFFVRLIESDQEKKGHFYHRSYMFTIRYHADPKLENVSDELERVQDMLCESLPVIRNDGLVLKCNPRFEISDGVLHVFCDYTLRLTKEVEEIKMSEIDKIEGGLR